MSLLQNPFFSAGMNILAANKGSQLQPIGQGVIGAQQQIQHNQLLQQRQQLEQEQQETLRKYRELQTRQLEYEMNKPPERKFIKDSAGLTYDQSTMERVFPHEQPAPLTNIGKLRQEQSLFAPGSVDWQYRERAIQKELANSEGLQKVADPNSPTGFSYVPNSQAAGRPAPPQGSGMALTVGPDGQIMMTQGNASPIELTSSNQTDTEKKMLSAARTIEDIDTIFNKLEPEFLSYGGRLKAGVGGVMGKVDPYLDNEYTQFAASRRNFANEINQMFNEYKVLITGAAAGEKEMEDLRNSIVNENLSYPEFVSAVKQFREKSARNLELNARMAGIDPTKVINTYQPKGFEPTGDPMKDAMEYLNGGQ